MKSFATLVLRLKYGAGASVSFSLQYTGAGTVGLQVGTLSVLNSSAFTFAVYILLLSSAFTVNSSPRLT